MVDSMANPMFGANGGTPKELVDATMRYVHNFPHVLAGFQGAGIDVVDEIHQFATSNNLQVHNLDLIKHMNADQATCGYGCSGNPYDAYWSFSPIGHGDIHEKCNRHSHSIPASVPIKVGLSTQQPYVAHPHIAQILPW